MPDTAADWLRRFQPYRRPAEVGFWVAVLALQVAFNSVVSWIDLGREGRGLPFWQPLAWEVTSSVVIGLLIPAVVAVERRFPLRWDTLRAHLGWHVAASFAFCAIHVALMVPLRAAVYAAAGEPYRFAGWGPTLAYEWLKDVRTYFMVLAAVWSWRLILLRLQGEARVLDAPEPPAGPPPGPASEAPADSPADPAAAAPPPRPERFLVRKLRKEFLIAAADIEWVQAEGNYVGLHVNGHDYLLRSTLSDFLAQLDPAKFARVHRSWAVNLDRIAEIEPLDGGDAKLRMKSGGTVPCSRRWRDALDPSRA
jgi:hypothetical protein